MDDSLNRNLQLTLQLTFRNVLALILFFICTTASFAAPHADYNENFLTLADIHFDPFYSCYAGKQKPCPVIQKLRYAPVAKWAGIFAEYDKSKPRYGLDTNYPLLQQALNESRTQSIKYKTQSVIILGDTLSHDMRRYYKKYAGDRSSEGYQEFVNKTLRFVVSEVNRVYSPANIYFVVGNNDTYQRNYSTRENGVFLRDAATIFADAIKTPAARQSLLKSFPYAGYYAVDLGDRANLRLIVLNSVVFSRKAVGTNINKIALTQLAWLKEQLQYAKQHQQKVMIAMHLPVAMELHLTTQWRLFTLFEFWKSDYSTAYKSLLNEYAPEIAAVLTGHTHTDTLQIGTMAPGGGEIVMSGTSAISPIYHTYPGFKIITYSSTAGRIEDVYSFIFSLSSDNWNLNTLHASNIRVDRAQKNPGVDDVTAALCLAKKPLLLK